MNYLPPVPPADNAARRPAATYFNMEASKREIEKQMGEEDVCYMCFEMCVLLL